MNDAALPVLDQQILASTTERVIFYFPDYTATNAYQKLLYYSLPDHYTFRPGSIADAIQYSQKFPGVGRTIFHLHWTAPILSRAKNLSSARECKENFIKQIKAFVNSGGLLIWTVHNVLPHDRRFIDVESELRQDIVANASHVLIHSMSTLEQVSQYYTIPRAKARFVPHGNYIGTYTDHVTCEEARRTFGLTQESIVFTFFGQFRPYKGLDELIGAFAQLRRDYDDVRLVLAGQPIHPIRSLDVTGKASLVGGITVREGHIPDDEVQLYLKAGDFAVFPYKDILSSGSIFAALSFGCPVIAPALGMIGEFIDDGVQGLVYDPSAPEALGETLRRAHSLSPQQRADMRLAARARAEEYPWTRASDTLAKFLEMPAPPAKGLRVPKAGHILKSSKLDAMKPASNEAVAAIVLNYRSFSDLRRCVSSLEASSYEAISIFIVDNRSPGVSITQLEYQFPECGILQAPTNLGYAGGNNLAIKFAASKGYKYFFVVNPDVAVEHDTVERLVTAAKADEKPCILGPVVCYGRRPNVIQFAGAKVRTERGLVIEQFLNGKTTDTLPQETIASDYVNGAALFFEKTVLDATGPLPEEYFLYFEETDWCLRAARAGISSRIIPNIRVLHYKASEDGNNARDYYLYYYIRGAILFTRAWSPDRVEATVQSLRTNFSGPWLAKMRAQSPRHLAHARNTVARAFRDGQAGVTGPVDLSAITEEGAREISAAERDTIRGYLDGVDGGNVFGWVLDASAQTEECSVIIRVDGTFVAEVQADMERSDLLDAGFESALHGFTYTLPDRYQDGLLHTIEVVESNSRIRLNKGRRDFRLFPTDTTRQKLSPSYNGRIDGIRNFSIQGWACDNNDLDTALDLEINCDDETIECVTADLYRQDLERSSIGHGRYGFLVHLPLRFLYQQNVVVKAKLASDKRVLFERVLSVPAPVCDLPEAFTLREFLNWSLFNGDLSALFTQQFKCAQVHLKRVRRALADLCEDQISGPLVSVVMPAFNRRETVLASIDSVRAQDYTSWELIVVDDGSSDGTASLVRQYMEALADDRLKLIELGNNRGVSAARNAALAASTGDYIAYLDSDCEWDNKFLQIMINRLADEPTFAAAYCGQEIWKCFDQMRPPMSECISLRSCPFNRSLIENMNFIDLNVFIHSRTMYESFGGFDEEMTRLVDWDLILRYTNEKRPMFVPALLGRYYIDKAHNQITKVEPYKKNQKRAYEKILEKQSRLPEVAKPRRSDKSLYCVSVCEQRGRYAAEYVQILSTTLHDYNLITVHDATVLNGRGLGFGKRSDGVSHRSMIVRYDLLAALKAALAKVPPEADLALMRDAVLPGPQWRDAVEDVLSSLDNVGIVTGRWVWRALPPQVAHLRGYATGGGEVDTALSLVKDEIVDLEPLPAHDFIELGRAPDHFVYVPAAMRAYVTAAAMEAETFTDVIHSLSDLMRIGSQARIIYSPSLKVLDASYVGLNPTS